MCPVWGCGCCHEFPPSPRPAWQCGTAVAMLWAGAVAGCHRQHCLLHQAWMEMDQPNAQGQGGADPTGCSCSDSRQICKQQVGEVAETQASLGVQSRVLCRGRGDWETRVATKGTSSKCRRDTSLAKALLKPKASLFVFCNTLPLRP